MLQFQKSTSQSNYRTLLCKIVEGIFFWNLMNASCWLKTHLQKHLNLSTYLYIYMGVSNNWERQNGWFTMKHPIKMDDLGVIHIITRTQLRIVSQCKSQACLKTGTGKWSLMSVDVTMIWTHLNNQT